MSMEPIPPNESPKYLPLDYARPSRQESRWGKGFLSLCATFVFVGVGHWIAGVPRRGIGCLAANLGMTVLTVVSLCVARLQPALWVLFPIQVAFGLAIYVDAFLTGRRSNRSMLGSPWRRYLAGVFLLVLAYFIGRTYQMALQAIIHPHAEAFVASSRAMAPTLMPGDRFLTIKSFDVQRWDVVVVHPPTNPKTVFLDRVVGLPGETVELIGGNVSINGVVGPPGAWGPYQSKLRPPRIGHGCQGHPITLGPDEFYLLGDNSSIAFDARYWTAEPGHQPGAVSRKAIVAKVRFVYWPPRNWRTFH
jgi:signal peptidase I